MWHVQFIIFSYANSVDPFNVALIFAVICRPSVYPEILRHFPNSAIQHIDGAGHWVHSEKPYEFLDVVLQFLKSVDS